MVKCPRSGPNIDFHLNPRCFVLRDSVDSKIKKIKICQAGEKIKGEDRVHAAQINVCAHIHVYSVWTTHASALQLQLK